VPRSIHTRPRGGFTLIELVIVVAVIAIIATIAIVNLLRSRMSANEAAAVANTRMISTAEISFKSAGFFDSDGDGSGDYGTLAQLGNPDGGGATQPFIDTVLATGNRLGYIYTVSVTLGSATTRAAYTCTAIPAVPGRTGYRQFFVDETGVVRYTGDGTAPTALSSPVD
jgi:prepilin-type N-terminal cleavage/methylation domain-containing protein